METGKERLKILSSAASRSVTQKHIGALAPVQNVPGSASGGPSTKQPRLPTLRRGDPVPALHSWQTRIAIGEAPVHAQEFSSDWPAVLDDMLEFIALTQLSLGRGRAARVKCH